MYIIPKAKAYLKFPDTLSGELVGNHIPTQIHLDENGVSQLIFEVC